ncbi:MAG TPA: transporter [Thermoanaerobaculia bacterium]|nr:transporter [Thermoanaerobaculia bacterium]
MQYGLFGSVEVNMDFPLIVLRNAPASGRSSAFGLGDVDFAVKWKMVEEAPDGARPAFTVNAAVEFPTGSESKELGSGVTDVVVNTIFQKTFSGTQLHFNAGIQFTGNTATGAVGIHTPGRIVIGGLSAARDFSERLRLGLDLNGAEVFDGGQVEKQLQLTAGGNYALTKNDTLDFAVIVGWYNAPRVGFVLGVSITP